MLGDGFLQKYKSDMIGKLLFTERNVTNMLVKRKIAVASMPREQLKTLRLRKPLLDLTHEHAADALALKIWMHDESANAACAVLKPRSN